MNALIAAMKAQGAADTPANFVVWAIGLLGGALGASVSFGIQQASQMLGGQGVGFISGEWRGVHGTP